MPVAESSNDRAQIYRVGVYKEETWGIFIWYAPSKKKIEIIIKAGEMITSALIFHKRDNPQNSGWSLRPISYSVTPDEFKPPLLISWLTLECINFSLYALMTSLYGWDTS